MRLRWAGTCAGPARPHMCGLDAKMSMSRSRGADSIVDTASMVCAVVLTGAPGSGKSSVLDALATRLEIEGVAHGAIESEELGRGFPALPGLRWVESLAAVLELQWDSGRRLFLVVATTETAQELRGVIDATRADRSLVACLVASAETVAERLQRREPDDWPGKQALIARARFGRLDAAPGGHRPEDRNRSARGRGRRRRARARDTRARSRGRHVALSDAEAHAGGVRAAAS